jgi:hypothetical protein
MEEHGQQFQNLYSFIPSVCSFSRPAYFHFSLGASVVMAIMHIPCLRNEISSVALWIQTITFLLLQEDEVALSV